MKDENAKGWFEPIGECEGRGRGNCLSCRNPACGIDTLSRINAENNPNIDINDYR